MNGFQSFYPQNYPQYQNVYQPPMNQQNQVQSSVVWVGSRNEAESFLVGANNSVTMWDSNGEYVYRKSADASGRPEFHAYKLLEEGAVGILGADILVNIQDVIQGAILEDGDIQGMMKWCLNLES